MSKQLKHPRRSLLELLTEAHRCGWCDEPLQVDESLVFVNPHTTWHAFARELSKYANGTWHPATKRCWWKNGRQTFYMMHPSQLEDLSIARQCVHDQTGTLPLWTFGNCARTLLKWALLPVARKDRDLSILEGGFVGYHECRPGRHNWGVHFDCNSCYYQLIARLQSPRLGLGSDGKIEFFPMLPDERARWRDALELIAPQKLLRNSVWGCMLGSTQPKEHFFGGQRRYAPAYEGLSYAAAAVVARSAWELCQQAAIESDASYAQTDGIITATGAEPRVWRDVQLEYSVKAHGLTDIQHQHSWACGGLKTKWYQACPRFEEWNLRPAIPDRLLYQEWLMQRGDRLMSRKGL